MLNYIWFGLMAIALVVAAFNGTVDGVTRGAMESASTAVQIAIGLVGIMTLWLGMMRVAEAAGLVSLLGRAVRPLLRRLFPEVPPDHPAAGAIVVAIAANMLGLNNAATPLGIKAMEELQALNPDKDAATNPMVTFLAMTTSGVQLIPATMIGVLAAAGSQLPTAIIAPSILATFVGTVAAVLAAKILQRLYPPPAAKAARGDGMIRAALDAISLWAIPVMLVGIPFVGLLRKVKVYDVFIEGATEGFDVAVRIIPFLVGHPRRDRDVPGVRCDGPARRRAAARRDHDRLPRRARAAGRAAIAHRQRIAGVRHRSHQDARTRFRDWPDGRHDVRLVRDHVLRAGRLLRGRSVSGVRGTRCRPRSLVTSLPQSLPSRCVRGCSDQLVCRRRAFRPAQAGSEDPALQLSGGGGPSGPLEGHYAE